MDRSEEPGNAAEPVESGRRSLYRVGGITALIAVGIPLAEAGISFLPGVAGASERTVTAIDWFTLLQNSLFLGLRNLGLLNMVGAALLAPTFLAIFYALKRDGGAYGGLGTVLFFVGMAVYLASNRALSILSLSRQYATATTDAQRSLLGAAGQVMLAESEGRAGIPLMEFGGLVVSAVMLRGRVFSKGAAYAGIAGNALLIVVEIILAVTRKLPAAGMVIAGGGGISIMAWYFLVGLRLRQLGRR